ncbi:MULTISPECIES: threonine/serine exporter family protein [Clostridium]|uniref:Threonine/serine exporter family protein n=1 Tax=Clostridium cibarium TaxID=2762247 RepID=A0ABR8PPR0_9CLOT|nr:MULTISPECIES: threonine/serine exporter family protein [Clostridium]MBD7910166.1 threonine/serine exporter family protein [Clostridium cibarium]
MDLNKLLKVATFAGKIMLESGAETYRVEETICRICLSFGVETADSFVTPTGIMVSISDNNETLSLIKRVTSRGVDLNKIDKVNDLSRLLQDNKNNTGIEDFYESLLIVNKGDRYSVLTTLIFSSIAAGAFSYLFGGDIKDLISATFVGLIIKIITNYFEKLAINEFFINSIGGGISALLAIILFTLGVASHIDKTIIGAIMLLVPGLAITNAIRDTIAGDYLAGITKASEAFLIAISIAVGTGAVLSFWINTLGGSII